MTVAKGLEGIIAASSQICYIDGDAGVLRYYGYPIQDLAEHSSFEETVFLLWNGRLPKKHELESFKAEMSNAGGIPEPIVRLILSFPKDSNTMACLRTAVSALALYDRQSEDMSDAANRRKAVRLQHQINAIVPAIDRARKGQPILQPRVDMTLAENFLYMLRGEPAKPEESRAIDMCYVLHADHELNASTFACRVTGATLADMHGSITAAIGALKGPLHGGANTDVMKMLLAIGDSSNAEAWIKDALSKKQRIMGFGHRVYKTLDPRAGVLKQMSAKLGKATGVTKWFEISNRIQELVKKEKDLNANVDFYSASVYYSLGIPLDINTPIFAISRCSGWLAHLLEQYADNRLIRPRAEYIGPAERHWEGFEKR
ncbi:MAG: citrate synthase [Planctomycetes bacterium]|nr:citrate synthase [Planctomycetota bacterium]